MTEKLYVVNTTVAVPVKTEKVLHESAAMYLLANKILVNKQRMGTANYLYFTDKALAETVASYIKMSLCEKPMVTNGQAIKNCTNTTSLAIILFSMIQTLCEDGMPSHEAIEEWLNTPVEDVNQQGETDTYGLEDYDELKSGAIVYYLDGKNVVRGQVFDVRKDKNGRTTYASVEIPNDFAGVAGSQFGKTLFMQKHLAEFFATN